MAGEAKARKPLGSLVVAIGGPSKGGPAKDDEEEVSGMDPGYESAVSELVSALGLDPEGVDLEAVGDALQAAVRICKAKPSKYEE